MRPNRLLLVPITALLALAAAGSASAANFNIDVVNYRFSPTPQRIAVGDSVTWTFSTNGHTSTSEPGQPQSWDSGSKERGTTYVQTFTKPGLYDYVCTPHESFPMRGKIQVGEDTVADTVDAFKTKRAGKVATISFKLNEAAPVTYKLKGPSKRTVTRKRLGAGKHSFKVKRLKKGSYTGTLTLRDDFDKKTTQKKSFKVR